MSDNVKKVFDMLGVEPYEEFNLEGEYPNSRYRVNKLLKVQHYNRFRKEWREVKYHDLHELLSGEIKILKKVG